MSEHNGHTKHTIWQRTQASSLATFTPAVPLTIVRAWANDDNEVEHQTLPVLAIECCRRHFYESHQHNHPVNGRTHADLVRKGWKYVGEEPDRQPLVLSEGIVLTLRELDSLTPGPCCSLVFPLLGPRSADRSGIRRLVREARRRVRKRMNQGN